MIGQAIKLLDTDFYFDTDFYVDIDFYFDIDFLCWHCYLEDSISESISESETHN